MVEHKRQGRLLTGRRTEEARPEHGCPRITDQFVEQLLDEMVERLTPDYARLGDGQLNIRIDLVCEVRATFRIYRDSCAEDICLRTAAGARLLEVNLVTLSRDLFSVDS